MDSYFIWDEWFLALGKMILWVLGSSGVRRIYESLSVAPVRKRGTSLGATDTMVKVLRTPYFPT